MLARYADTNKGTARVFGLPVSWSRSLPRVYLFSTRTTSNSIPLLGVPGGTTSNRAFTP